MSVFALLGCLCFVFLRQPYILSTPNYEFVLADKDDYYTLDGGSYKSGEMSFKLGMSKSYGGKSLRDKKIALHNMTKSE